MISNCLHIFQTNSEDHGFPDGRLRRRLSQRRCEGKANRAAVNLAKMDVVSVDAERCGNNIRRRSGHEKIRRLIVEHNRRVVLLYTLCSLPFRRRVNSRDRATWTKLAGRQKLTNCNSSCEKELVGLMSGRNERTSVAEKPADCNASLVSPEAEGSRDASRTLEAMLPLVYDELRLLAGGYLRNERPEHTLQRTALVHEAYLRLAAQRDLSWENPAHFLAIFARLMRQTLINHAVARTRAKRGGSDPTDLILEFYDRHQIDVTAVDEALKELEALDARQAQIVELRFFGGLKIEEIARLLEISPATVKREWAVAKLWLRQTLSQGE